MSKVVVVGIVGNSVFMPVDEFHVGGETVEAKSLRFEYGGKGFNQAVAAARWGAEVSFIAAVGNDGYDGIKEFLKKEKVNSVLIRKDEPTAFASIITDKTGANRVTVYQGAQLSIKDVDSFEDEIKKADVLLLNNEVAEEINLALVKIAKNCGVKIILNPAPYKKIKKEVLDSVFIFTPNEHEAKDLAQYKNVIQTLGSKGCYIKADNVVVPAERVTVVDTTGAGDTFSGVLAAEIADGHDINTAVGFAVKASGVSVTRPGAVSSIPFKNEIQ